MTALSAEPSAERTAPERAGLPRRARGPHKGPRSNGKGSRPNGLERAGVADIQRARVLAAMFDLACERGAGNVTVAHVVQRSGVSRRTFYDAFNDRNECFLAALDEAVAHASERVLSAYSGASEWRERIRAALTALLSFFDEEPAIANLLVCESLAGGPRALERHRLLFAQMTRAIGEGREQSKASSAALPLAAEGIVGGALSVVHARLSEPRHKPLVDLVNPLMGMIVLPYLGVAAAQRELARPTPAPATASRATETTPITGPFKDAGMRLTYRTVRALVAIADCPRASNRTVGKTAGISDQGQISKLLARLERIGLVSNNSGLGRGQGAPNAWSLTPTGHRVVNSIRAHVGTANDL